MDLGALLENKCQFELCKSSLPKGVFRNSSGGKNYHLISITTILCQHHHKDSDRNAAAHQEQTALAFVASQLEHQHSRNRKEREDETINRDNPRHFALACNS